MCQRRNYSCSSRILKPEPATQWSHPRILGSELSTQWQILRSELSTQWQILRSELSTQWPHPVASFRTVGGCFRYRISLPYQRSLFFTQSASENASRTVGGCSAHRVPIPYRRRVFPVPNFPAVPQPKRVRVSALTYPMYKDSRMGALLFFCSLVSLIPPTAHQPLINRK